MKKKVLLGATKEKEIAFGEFEVTTRNGYPEFTACFETVRPFKGNDIDLESYFEDYADPRCCGAEYVLDLCTRYACSPQDLPKELADECYDVRDALDCSLFPEEYEVNGNEWYFESSSCGQHDTRGEGMAEYVDKAAYDLLHELWDAYHLKNVSEVSDLQEKLEQIESALNVDWEDWITDYIEREVE